MSTPVAIALAALRAAASSLRSAARQMHPDCRSPFNLTMRNIVQSFKINAFICNFATAAAVAGTLGFAASAHAQQSFTATVDGKTWESDNDGINVIPVSTGGSVTITAVSKGFSAYPPPKGFADQF